MRAPGRERSGEDRRLEAIDAAMQRHGRRADALVEVLHVAQEAFGYLPEDVLAFVARGLGVPPSRVYGVATFYDLFRLAPRGEHVCTVCVGTACWVDGAAALLAAAEEAAGIRHDETTADGWISIAAVRCIGACGGSPVVAWDERLSGRETVEGVRAALDAWRRR